ncbi:MAG: sigma-70 family RNA polymerase sigma factor, partial [Planctomycetota bacterium]|nr:sigma-70 family RNA polymerase sigma factor [Planctomycetota bacterium]
MAHPSTRSVEALLGHEPWLRDLASRLARPGTEADDLVQDTWLSVLKRPLRGDPRGWLYRVTTNAARLDRRTGARRRARELDHEQLHASPAVDEVHADLEIHRVLLDELDELEEPYRTVLALRFLEGKSLSAVATRLDVPRDTVKSQQARGIERLRRRLDRRMGDRGQWMTALVPLLPSRSTIWTLLMIPSSKVVVAAVMITGLVALLAYGRRDVTELPFPDGATDPQRSASERGASIASEGPSTSQSRREQAAPSSPASSDPAAGDRVTGQVVDHTGSPLSGVRVHEVRDTTHFVTTDARGEFTWPDPDEPVELTPSGPDLWAVTTRWVRPGDPDPLRLVLAPAIHLAGRVVDEVGRPLERATLHVRLPDAWSRDLEGGTYGATKRGVFAGCDGLGRFDMQEVPAVPEALIWVEHGERSAVFSMPLASNLSLELRLVQVSEDQRWATVPHLTGRVTDGIGQPVENVRVVTEHFYSDSAADGTFRFPLSCLARAQSLSLVRRGHVPSEVARPGPRWPDHLELRIDDRPVSAISGRLVDHEGRPLADRKVWILEGAQLRPGLESSCLEEEVGAVHDRTDQEGRFSLTALPEQLYRVAAFDRESWTRVESRRVPAGTNQLELVVSEPPSPLTLRRRLVDRDG